MKRAVRSLCSLCCLWLLALPVFAAADDNLAHQIMSLLAQQQDRHFSFVQEKKLAMLAKPLVTEGELQIDNDQTVTWDIRKPYVLRYVLTRDQIREIDDQGERILTTGQNPLAAALTQAMAATFSGRWQDAQALARITASGTMAGWQLQITPQAAELQALISAIVVNGRDGNIHSVVIAESNGDSATIRLSPLAR